MAVTKTADWAGSFHDYGGAWVSLGHEEFGIVGDNSTDDTAGIQAAVDRLGAISGGLGGTLYVPRFTSHIKFTSPIDLDGLGRLRILGHGIGSSFYFYPTANGQAAFHCNDGDNHWIEGISVYVATKRLNIDLFDFANSGLSAVTFRRCFLEGWTRYGINLDSMQHLLIDRCRFLNGSAYDGTTTWTTTPAEAIRCTTWLNRATINECRFEGNDKVARIVLPTSVNFRGCAFEANGDNIAQVTGINYQIEASDGGNVLSVEDGYVEGNRTGTNQAFLYTNQVKNPSFRGNHCDGSLGGTTYTERFVTIEGADARGGDVSGNRFVEVGDYFVESVSGKTVRAYDNTYMDGGVELTDHNAVMALMSGRVEVNNLQIVSTVDPPSIADGSSWTSSAITATGVILGCQVDVSVTADLQGLSASAYVSSAGNVKVTLVNNTGGAVDLGSTDFRFFIRWPDV